MRAEPPCCSNIRAIAQVMMPKGFRVSLAKIVKMNLLIMF